MSDTKEKIGLIIFSIFFLSDINAQKNETVTLSSEQFNQIKATATELYRKLDRVTPGERGAPPSDAFVLFDGSSLDEWQKPYFEYRGSMVEYADRLPELKRGPHITSPADWKLEKGEMVVVPGAGHVVTKKFLEMFNCTLNGWLQRIVLRAVRITVTADFFLWEFMKFKY